MTQVVARVKNQLGLELPVRDFFANPTIELAARHIQAMLGDESKTADEATAAIQSQRDRLPVMEAFFLPSGAHDLFAVHYSPPSRQTRRNRAVVLCHAYGHEYARSYRNLQQLAVHLAQQGFDVLRFDYAGTGNSHGNALEASPHVMMKNIRDVSNWMRQRHELDSVSLIGIRLGATLAACSAATGINQRLLWDPVFCGETFLQNLDQLHAKTLTNEVRFARPRESSSIDQAYGTRLNHVVRRQLSQLKLDLNESQDAPATTLLLSQDYEVPGIDDSPSSITGSVIQMDDEIGWDRPELNESAFSSPGAIRHITQLLVDKLDGGSAIEVQS